MTSELQPAGLNELLLLVASLDEPDLSAAAGISLDDPYIWQRLREDVSSFMYDPQCAGGLAKTLLAANRTASIVRDRISVDSWRIINQLKLSPPEGVTTELGDSLLSLNQLLVLLSAFSGLCNDSMTRGPGWRFLDIGRRIERGLQALNLIGGLLVDVQSDLLPRLEAMLEIADSSMTYRYRYLTTLQLAPVLDLVLSDESNPRAVGFQLAVLAGHVRYLARDSHAVESTNEQQIVLSAQAELRLVDVEAFCTVNGLEDRTHLNEFLKLLSAKLRALSVSITDTYLAHTVSSHQLDTKLVAVGTDTFPIA